MKIIKKDKTIVCILGLAGFISAADNWVVSPILSAIAAEFGVSISQAGSILTAYMIPYGLMQPVYGFFSDRFGKTKILQGCVGGMACGTMGCYLAGSLEMLCCWRFVTGFFAAGVIAVSLALIGDTVVAVKRQKFVGIFMGIVFLGQGLSVGLGGIFAQYINWRAAFVFFSGTALCTLLFLQKLPQSRTYAGKQYFFAELKQVVTTPTGRVIFPLAFFTGFLLLGLYSYLGAFLHEMVKLNYLQVGLVIMFYGFACLVAGVTVDHLQHKVGPKKTIVIGGCLAFITTILLAGFSCWPAGWLGTISLGFGYIFIQSTLATLAFDIAANSKGLSSALIGLGLFGGGGLSTAFSSWLLVQQGYQILWLTFGEGIIVFVFVTTKLHFDS